MVARTTSRLLRRHLGVGRFSFSAFRKLRRSASLYWLHASSSSRWLWGRMAARADVGISVFGLLAVIALVVVWYIRLTQVGDATDQSVGQVDIERVLRDDRFYRDGVQLQSVDNSAYQLTVSPSDPNKAALSQLVDWLAPSASFRSVYIQHDNSGDHCLHALHTLPSGHIAVSIPHSHMLTLTEAKASDIGRQLMKRWDDTTTHTYMAAYLLTEAAKVEESAWWAYLHALPASTSHLASAWSEEELAWLQGTSALITARDQQQAMRETYDKIRTLPSFPFTYESFAHARRLVASRLFGYRAEGNRSSALVPLLDLVNHANSAQYNTLWTYDTTLRAFTMSTTRPLSAHQPLLTSYGDKSNAQLLTSYGFVMDDNVWDDVEVGYEGVDEDGGVVEKVVQLRPEYGGTRSQLFVLNVRRFALQDVLTLLTARLGRAQNKTLTEADVGGKQRGMRVLVELRVLQRIVEAINNADARYGGDRAAEAARLSGWMGVKGKEWQALVVRVGERRVLQWWLDVCALGERWLAEGANAGELWASERAEVGRLKVETLVKDVWVKMLEDEKNEEDKTEQVSPVGRKRQRVTTD